MLYVGVLGSRGSDRVRIQVSANFQKILSAAFYEITPWRQLPTGDSPPPGITHLPPRLGVLTLTDPQRGVLTLTLTDPQAGELSENWH